MKFKKERLESASTELLGQEGLLHDRSIIIIRNADEALTAEFN